LSHNFDDKSLNDNSKETGRVAVVGGGFTGITAAYRLALSGHKVTVFEAGDVLGGLAGGCTLLGQPVEKAYHFLYKTDEYMLRLLSDLDIEDSLTFHKSSVSTYYDSVLYPMENPIDLIRFTPLSFVNRIRAGLSVLYLQNVKNWQKLTSITAIDWLRKYAGKEVTDVIWEPLLKGKFDRYYDQVTMCWLWGRIKQRVESRDSELKGEALGYINNGFVTVIDAMVKQIENAAGEFAMNTPIESIEYIDSEGSVNVTTASGNHRFDRVLLTVPCGVTNKLLSKYQETSPEYFKKLNSIDYLDAAVLLFATDKPITKYYWHNINTPDSPFVVFLSLTSLIGTEKFNGKHVYYIGDYIPREHPYMSDSKDELTNKWFEALGDMFPEFDRSSVIEDQLYRFKDAQHIVDTDFEQSIVDHESPCPNVFLCNFSQIFPMDRGTNYAVRDGYRMADMIADSFSATSNIQ